MDLDRYIVNKERMQIKQIFAEYGEPHFRALEAKYIKELSGGNVVATGGGALLNDESAKFAKMLPDGSRQPPSGSEMMGFK